MNSLYAAATSYMIKEYFANYFLHMSDVTFDMSDNVHVQNNAEPWSVTLVDTGEHSMTGGRLLRVRDFVKDGHSVSPTEMAWAMLILQRSSISSFPWQAGYTDCGRPRDVTVR